MHTAKALTSNTKAGQLFWYMREYLGQWMSGWRLSQELHTTCLSTHIAEIRQMLANNPTFLLADNPTFHVEHKQRGHEHFYRVVRR